MKYRPDYPQRFDSQVQAHTWAKAFFPWYNHEHHHLALALLTPAMVHFGQAAEIIAQRKATLDAAYTSHPERFALGAPTPPSLPAAVWINPPALHKGAGAENG
jgi:putative transposase